MGIDELRCNDAIVSNMEVIIMWLLFMNTSVMEYCAAQCPYFINETISSVFIVLSDLILKGKVTAIMDISTFSSFLILFDQPLAVRSRRKSDED